MESGGFRLLHKGLDERCCIPPCLLYTSALNCAEQKAIKLLSELEKKAGLIERKRQGLGKPNLIYVKNFISAVDSQLLNCENHNSGTMEITTQEKAFILYALGYLLLGIVAELISMFVKKKNLRG